MTPHISPGPWIRYGTPLPDHCSGLMVVDRRGNVIAATVAGCNVNRAAGGDVSTSEAEANLRAIEQVPEMCEILEEMQAMIRECPRSYCLAMARRIEGVLSKLQ